MLIDPSLLRFFIESVKGKLYSADQVDRDLTDEGRLMKDLYEVRLCPSLPGEMAISGDQVRGTSHWGCI
jgi:hypothetical protein